MLRPRKLWKGASPTRTIQEGQVLRVLDPESESEAEIVDDPCEAVLVGLEHSAQPRALATDPRTDQATGPGARLLGSDRSLSDVKRKGHGQTLRSSSSAVRGRL